MEPYQIGQLVVSAVGTFGLLATFGVYYAQLRNMQKQLAESRRASEAQNLLSVAAFLENEDLRLARKLVLTILDPDRYETWSDPQLDAASRVCSTYTVAGAILDQSPIPRQPFFKTWGYSIRECHRILKPHIDARRGTAEPGFWAYFDWLNEQAKSAIAQTAGRGLLT